MPKHRRSRQNPFHRTPIILSLLEKRQRQRRLLIRLRQNRRTCLLQNVQAGQVRSFLSDVYVADLALCRSEVLSRYRQIVDRYRESAFHRAERSTV